MTAAQVIGKRIRERRVLLQMTQVELARLAGVDQSSVSQWERGVTMPSRRNEAAILEALRAHGTGLFDLPAGVSF